MANHRGCRGILTEPNLGSAGTSKTGKALISLIFMRIIYAINWLNIAAVFYAMAPDLGSGVLGLGTLTSSFYLGLGLLQVPGGIMAAKWGPKKLVVGGTMFSSLSAIATGLAPTLWSAAVLRFCVGAGMALVFAPAVVIISKMVRSGGSGAGVGLFNSAYDVGGILALFLWGVIASATGWRPSLELSGALGVASGLLVMVTVPVDERKLEFRVKTDQMKRVLFDSGLIIIALGMMAVSVGNGLISSFMEYYLVSQLHEGAAEAGAIASMVVAVPIFSALYAGRLYDRTRRTKALMLSSNAASMLALAVCALSSLPAAVFTSVVGGLISGFGFTVGFAAAKDTHTAEKEYDGLAVAWVNCISLFGVVFPPLVFSYIADASGYPPAWLAGVALTAIFAVPLLFLRDRRARAA